MANLPLQCDGARPICQNCTKSRRVCLQTSSAKQAGLSIHNENDYASGESKRPRGPRSSLTLLRPQFDLHTQALAYYLQYHVQTLTDVPNVSRGLSECVSAWKLSGRTCPMVDLAVSSMALAVYSRIQHHPAAAIEASSKYHRLLRVAQERISQVRVSGLNDQDIDACLLAVFLMGRYEGVTPHTGNLNAKSSFSSLPIWSHHNGAMALLKVWHDGPSHSHATYIMKQTRRGLIRSSLLRNLPLPDWMLDGEIFGERDLELNYDRIFVRIVNLHYVFTTFRRKNGRSITEAEKLDSEAQELDKALQDWATKFPSIWSHQQHILNETGPWPSKHYYSPIIYSYSRPEFTAAWNQYFALRMLVNSMRSRIFEALHTERIANLNHEQQWQDCITKSKRMADSLAASIPFCLERVKSVDGLTPSVYTLSITSSITLNVEQEIKPYLSVLVVWPLTIACSLEDIDPRQRSWFKAQLTSLGKATGEGILECVEKDQLATL